MKLIGNTTHFSCFDPAIQAITSNETLYEEIAFADVTDDAGGVDIEILGPCKLRLTTSEWAILYIKIG